MASIIKADNIQKVSDGSNIIKKCGSTITLGSCGATISLACGATQTGFGQTYSATAYCTTVKTAPFTAVAGKGYFVNTTCGAVTVTLPASPSAGDIVSVADYAGTWGTNNLTLCRNSSKIGGTCNNGILNSSLQSISLIYIDGTQGWKTVNDATVAVGAPSYIVATGGTITCCGDYRIHTFTADGCFAIASAPTPANNNVDYLVVAGGGGAGSVRAGGGGGGGYRESHTVPVSGCYTASPLASATSLPVSVTTYPITVGGGGAGAPAPVAAPGVKGSDSIFSTITSTGGGYGADDDVVGGPGGSGGGAGGGGSYTGGSGNTPPTSPAQGTNGGTSIPAGSNAAGGGGGATVAGSANEPTSGGAGGAGATTSISGSPVAYAGGGGGGGAFPSGTGGVGGTGGGGEGGDGSPLTPRCGQAGTANTGGGGGGAGEPGANGAAGGSGIVIIRYKFQ